MKKRKKILLWSAGTIVFIVLASYITMEIGVKYALNMMQSEVPVINAPANDSDTVDSSPASPTVNADDVLNDDSGPSAEADSNAVDAGSKPSDGAQSSSEVEKQAGSSNKTANGTASETVDETVDKTTTFEGAADKAANKTTDVNSTGAVEQTDTPQSEDVKQPTKEKPDLSTYEAEISADKGELVQEEITIKEKLKLTSVILKNFSSEELKLFSQMAGDGISIEEKKAAKELFLEKLSEKEYNDLIAIAAKYGLSQGKSYNETK